MRALLDDVSVIEHQDAVAFEHRGKAMRDHDCRASLHQPVERRLHQRLALGIECGRRFIEQQQRRIAEDGARDRDALALPAG